MRNHGPGGVGWFSASRNVVARVVHGRAMSIQLHGAGPVRASRSRVSPPRAVPTPLPSPHPGALPLPACVAPFGCPVPLCVAPFRVSCELSASRARLVWLCALVWVALASGLGCIVGPVPHRNSDVRAFRM